MKKTAAIFAVLMLSVCAFMAQEANPKLTDAEKGAIRTYQANMLQAKISLMQAQADYNNALSTLNSKVTETYAAHKISEKEYALCPGPTAGPCEKAPANDLVLMPMPKETKKETK